MKLRFNNPAMALCAISMGKAFRILFISGDGKKKNNLFQKHDLVSVSTLPEQEEICLLADCYAPLFRSHLLQNISTSALPFTNLYILSDGHFFQVAHVSNNQEGCNAICLQRRDVALIATDNDGRHYLASIQAASFKGVAA